MTPHGLPGTGDLMALQEQISDFVASIKERISRLTILDGRGYKVEQTLKGQVLHINLPPQTGGSSSGSSVVPAKIVSKDGAFYLVDLYEDGFDEDPTEEDVTAQILMLNYAETLPAGTEVLVASSYIDATG